jgi:glutamine amidotransferase
VNLRELASHIESHMFLAHVRATTGTAIQQTNCHPFRHGKWLFVHNGVIADFEEIRRELVLAVAPELFSGIKGSTDSEVLFHLALTFGLKDDPVGAVEQTLGLVESLAESHGVGEALQASIGVSDGERLWAVRYATVGPARTLFHSADVESAKAVYQSNSRLERVREGDVLVVSEPFSDLPGLWVEIPESTALEVDGGGSVEQRPFTPRAPAAAVAV